MKAIIVQKRLFTLSLQGDVQTKYILVGRAKAYRHNADAESVKSSNPGLPAFGQSWVWNRLHKEL